MNRSVHSQSIRGAARRNPSAAILFTFGLVFVAASCEADAVPAGKPTASGAIGVAAIDEFIAGAPITKEGKWKQQLPTPPMVGFDKEKTYFWVLDTNVGSIKVELLPQYAPMHVSSTIYLTRLGFYDDVKFHRVIQGFMAQGGDPTGTGRGGPGYRYAGEFHDKAIHDKPGMLSMANSGPNTDGSQFFLTFKATPHLNGKHTVFGRVAGSMDAVKELEKNGSGGRGTTKIPLMIQKATIVVE
ncbi:MAG: peptidyl-prolyl cis-trans isomerase B (cyclophilin B) [Myxococcota bacterium]|jgi:peptidyl-prolyl cis-trans isomerase B (cyclophilin B)